jgi:dihydroxyacid dehydratase/phosphogluconate dehydratase
MISAVDAVVSLPMVQPPQGGYTYGSGRPASGSYSRRHLRISGGTRGPCIGHVAPEAEIGGPIALVRDGDTIAIDLAKKSLDIIVAEKVLKGRRRSWKPRKRPLAGVLARYAATVEQANLGAVQR